MLKLLSGLYNLYSERNPLSLDLQLERENKLAILRKKRWKKLQEEPETRDLFPGTDSAIDVTCQNRKTKSQFTICGDRVSSTNNDLINEKCVNLRGPLTGRAFASHTASTLLL